MNTNFESLKKKHKDSLIQIVKDLAEKNDIILTQPPQVAMLAWESVIEYLLENPTGSVYLQMLAIVQRKQNKQAFLYEPENIPFVKIVGLCDDLLPVKRRLTRMAAGFGIKGLGDFIRVKNYNHDADHLKFAIDVRNYLNGFYELYYGPYEPKDKEVGS